MKKFFATLLMIWLTAAGTSANVDDAQKFKDAYNLQQHSEGGWFTEIYTAPFRQKKSQSHSRQHLLPARQGGHFAFPPD